MLPGATTVLHLPQNLFSPVYSQSYPKNQLPLATAPNTAPSLLGSHSMSQTLQRSPPCSSLSHVFHYQNDSQDARGDSQGTLEHRESWRVSSQSLVSFVGC